MSQFTITNAGINLLTRQYFGFGAQASCGVIAEVFQTFFSTFHRFYLILTNNRHVHLLKNGFQTTTTTT
jgi:hypothetical protein